LEEMAQKNNGLGLLWQRDSASNFPFAEIRSARRRFMFRSDLKGETPAEVHLHPEHAGLVQHLPDDLKNLIIVFNDKLPLFHIVLSGRAAMDSLLKSDHLVNESVETLDD
jgi:hypothetical protein